MDSLGEIKKYMPCVLSWLSSLGVNSNSSRFSKYFEDIEVFFDSPFTSYSIKEEQLRTLNKATYECWNIILIYKAFKSESNEKLIERLKRIIKDEKYIENQNTVDSRNIFFELIIASKLKLTGFDIDLSTNTDVIAKANSINFYIECKRIASEKGLEENIKKAGKQLQKQLENSDMNSYGLIYIDISSAITKYFIYEEFLSIHAYKKYIKESVEQFLFKNKKLINKLNMRFINDSLGVAFFCSKIVNIHKPFGIYLVREENIQASEDLPDKRFNILELYAKQCKPF